MKLFNKVAAIAVGLSLAAGVGAGIVLGQRSGELKEARAAEQTLTIGTSDFNSTSYAANNGNHTTGSIGWYSNQVYSTSGVMQWQKNNGYIYNTTNLGTIKSVVVDSTAGSFTTYYGTSEHPTSGTTVGGGFFTVVVGNAIGKTNSIVVTYEPSSSSVAVTGVSVNPTSATVKVGKTTSLTATVQPTDATNKAVTWSSSDESVATVNAGTVTGISAGTATITATTVDGNKTADCTVTVQAIQTIESNVADALTAANALASGATSEDLYCVTGYVTNVDSPFSSQYNNVGFFLADTKGGTTTIQCYRISCSAEVGAKVVVGAKLKVTGNLKNHNGNTPEVVNNTGVTTAIVILEEAHYDEPTLVTGKELSDLFADASGNGKQLYEVTGVVSAWQSGKTDATKFGNFYLQEEGDTSTSYFIYGATATASALTWNSSTGVYDFNNPQDFLTDTLTKDVNIGDKLTMRLTRCDYNTTSEAYGIVLSVEDEETPEIPEPTLVTGKELSDLFADASGNGKQLYEVTGVVSAWKTGESNGTQYGNFYLQEEGDTSTSYFIYGATATASALSWSSASGMYTFSNPKDFLTNEITSEIEIGDKVTMKLTRCDHDTTLEATGIITNVVHGDTPVIDPSEYLTKVESTSDISDGKYLIAYADGGLCFDGSLTSLDASGNTKEMTLGNLLTCYFTITNGKIKSASNKYIGNESDSNALKSSDTELDNTVSFDDNGNLVVVSSGGAYLRYNATSGQERFRYFKSATYTSQKAIQLYKVNFAKVMLGEITCNSAGTSQPTGSWNTLESYFGTLSTEEKNTFKTATANESGTDIEKAMAKYDYIVGKYLKGQGIATYNDFVGRNPAAIGASRSLTPFSEPSSAAALVVVVMSAVSVTAIGGFFLLKRKPF